MIINYIKLHSSFQNDVDDQIGYVFNSSDASHPVIRHMRFGNELYWNRNDLWKVIEILPTVQNRHTTVEHIVAIDSDKKIKPIMSKYFDNGSIAVYSQTYKSGIEYLGFKSDNLSNSSYSHISNKPVGAAICPRMLVPYLLNGSYSRVYPFIDTWIQQNKEIHDISPVRDFWGRNSTNEFSVEDYYLPFTQPSNKFWYYKGRLLSNGAAISIYDANMIAKDLADTLDDAYIEAKQGNCDESIITDILVDTIAPWKRQIYRDIDNKEITMHLGSIKQFIDGEMTVDRLINLSSPTSNIMHQTFILPDAKDINGVKEYISEYYLSPITYSKEFASILEHIQSISLTDFCFMYDIQQFSTGQFSPEIIFMLNRYYPKNNFGNLFPNIFDSGNNDYVFKDRSEELGKLLCDWLITTGQYELQNFTKLKLIRTYNEELFFYFDNTPVYADVKLMYYDLIGGIVCGRQMCNTNMV